MGLRDKLNRTRVVPIHTKSSSTAYDAQAPPTLDPAFGLNAAIKTFYEGPKSTPGSYAWVNKPPKQLSSSAAREYDGVAIKVFKVKNRDKPCIGGTWPLKYFSIDVQNPALVEAFKPILREKTGSRLDADYKLTFSEPFQDLWFCQEEIENLRTTAENLVTLKPYLDLLLNVMDDMFSELRFTYKKIQQTGLVDFYNAWTLFPRETPVYNFGLNSDMLCKIESVAYKVVQNVEKLVATAKILSFNGSEFIWQNVSLSIPRYKDGKPISELQFYPLKFHENKNDLFRRLVARGKRVLDLQGLEYCRYDGIGLNSEGGDCDIKKHNVEGRILVDIAGYYKYHSTKGLREYQDPSIQRANPARRNGRVDLGCGIEDVVAAQPAATNEQTVGAKRRRLTEAEMLENKNFMLEKEEDLAYVSGLVGGYALKNKLWSKCDAITWSPNLNS